MIIKLILIELNNKLIFGTLKFLIFQFVASVENITILIELIGINIADTIGESIPWTAKESPTTL